MSPMPARPSPRLRLRPRPGMDARRRARLLRALVGIAAVVLAWGILRPTEARLRPYYVVQAANFGSIQPRILFVLDTSGSMAFRTDATGLPCLWNECESTVGTPTASRMATARAAIRSVVEGLGDNASFALMTFEQASARLPPAVPPVCAASGADSARRFTWVTQFNDSGWRSIDRDPGVDGAWRLCQGSPIRPYAYLRWDELGVGAVIGGNSESGAVPPSPLISVAAGDIDHVDNSQRRVQWFDRFMGVRVHLDDTTDPGGTITQGSVGDYGADDATRDAEVRGHDFYYWPYVDGFPGYYNWRVWPFASGGGNADRAGVASEENSVDTGQLYAPFFIDLSGSGLPTDVWGPATREAGNASVLALTSPITEGGVDAGGRTPWRSVIGPITATPPDSNLAYAHTTVASYLGFATGLDTPDACSPVSAVLLTDGEPSSGEGGGELYRRIADLRTQLGVDVYVVGFFLSSPALNAMACAGAGACDGGTCDSPCDDTPVDDWDTCNDADNPEGACAYVATNSAELVQVFTEIVNTAVDVQLPSGQGSTVNSFGVGADGTPGEGTIVQTNFAAYTEFPGWRGHVTRSLCTEVDGVGVPLPHCTLPSPEFEPEELEETFGPCPQSHVWDAGACLQSTPWSQRRLYTNAAGDHTLIPIADGDGNASGAFRAELDSRGLLTSADHEAEANAIAAFVLGENAPGGWKLPGVASSAPVVVRRVPPFRSDRVPEVAINDPHCAGRLFGEIDAGALPNSLENFAREANDEDNLLGSPSPHSEYQEAVLVGDDMGVLHAFQLDSGNELWGFVPNELLPNLVAQAANGPVNMGQPDAVDQHIYGVSATVNHGWAFDPGGSRWVHLGVFGFGAGGQEYYALDLSHMSPESPAGPFEILWSTEDPLLAGQYDNLLGQTWARPALTYHVPDDDSLSSTPEARLVLGSGYRASTTPQPGEGRTMILADAVTGEILDMAELPALTGPVFEGSFGALVDPAVGSHCLSRYWAEAQETYIADPAGRLFRWDLGAGTAHSGDSGDVWGGSAQPVVRFPACEGTGTECSIDPSNRGDAFLFPPAISASNRIDDVSAVANNTANIEPDEFLVALVSGGPADDTIDGRDPANAFHSSLYLLVDNHRTGDTHAGFTIPAGAPKLGGSDSVVGATFPDNAGYLRLALSDIERTRTVIPYAGADAIVETRAFSKLARPVRPPRIFVTGVADNASGEPVVIEGIEVYLITYTVFEPATGECNQAFFDTATDTWHFDLGSTYEITFRLVADASSGFDFIAGATPAGVDFGGGFTPGLTLAAVDQIAAEGCTGGACGIVTNPGSSVPCDNNVEPAPTGTVGFAVPASSSQIPGFTPVE